MIARHDGDASVEPRPWTLGKRGPREESGGPCIGCGGPTRGRTASERARKKYCSVPCRRKGDNAWRSKRRICEACGTSFGPRQREDRYRFERRKLCCTACIPVKARGKMSAQKAVLEKPNHALPEFGSEAERLAFMRGIYEGWRRGIASHERWGPSTGNLIMDAVSWSLSGLQLGEGQKAAIYRRASEFPIPQGKLPKLQPHRRGGHRKLSERDVEEIKKLYATGEYSHRELGKRFGVDRSTVQHVLAGRSWQRPEELERARNLLAG